MPHEIRRLMRAFSTTAWFIDPRKAEQILAMLEFRAAHGPRLTPYRETPAAAGNGAVRQVATVAVLKIYGTIVPKMSRVQDVSATAASLEDFGRAFDRVAADPNVKAIVLDIDSPGGSVDLVPETVAKIRAAKRADRPIVAVANTLAASAAYWIAIAADELVVSPSAEVGSIGVYMVHQDVSQALAQDGVAVTFISAGDRKVEGNPFEPLGDEARGAFAETVAHYYDLFVKDVARGRGVPVARVRADPEKADRHFGGGRVYPAARAVALGMADRVATFDQTLARLAAGSKRPRRKT